MKIGVLQFFAWPQWDTDLPGVYARAMERIEIMDQTGYDAVWLAEHHFSRFSVCPSIHMVGTLVAARTKRLRIGTGVSLAPFYHPLRLAEEVALLDLLSGGRVNWGAGRGFSRGEFNAFGVPAEESTSRFHEGVDIVLRAWTEERVSYQGKHYSFDNVELLPKPQQQPHPPVWMAASSEGAIDWAASRGFSIMMDPHSTHDEIAAKRSHYTTQLAAIGLSDAGRDIPMARLIAIAPTAEKAEAVARRGAEWMVASYVGPQHKSVHPQGKKVHDDPIERYVREVMVHGTPESVVDQVKALEERLPLNYLLCAPLSRESFQLLTEKVLPKLL